MEIKIIKLYIKNVYKLPKAYYNDNIKVGGYL
jgi:hypothetical protein